MKQNNEQTGNKQGFSKFDTILIRIIHWYFNKRKISVTFFYKTERKSPSEKLHIISNGNIGVSTFKIKKLKTIKR